MSVREVDLGTTAYNAPFFHTVGSTPKLPDESEMESYRTVYQGGVHQSLPARRCGVSG